MTLAERLMDIRERIPCATTCNSRWSDRDRPCDCVAAELREELRMIVVKELP